MKQMMRAEALAKASQTSADDGDKTSDHPTKTTQHSSAAVTENTKSCPETVKEKSESIKTCTVTDSTNTCTGEGKLQQLHDGGAEVNTEKNQGKSKTAEHKTANTGIMYSLGL